MTGAPTRTRRPTADRPVAVPASLPPTDRAIVANVLAATLLATGLRVFHLGAQSLWIDEIFTWFNANVHGPLTLADVLQEVHGPLYSVVVHLWGGLAGDSEWALRAPSLLFGVALVPALAWLAARWLGRGTAAPAAWLAAGSPFLVWYSQEARNYTLLVLCATLACAFLAAPAPAAGPARPSRGRVPGFLASAWAGLLSNFSFALLAPLHARWWLAGARRADLGRRLAGGAALVLALLVLLSPWAPQVLSTWDWRRLHPAAAAESAEQPPLRGATTFHPAAVPFALHAFAVGYTLGPTLRELKSGAAGAAVARHGIEVAAVALVFGALGIAGLRGLARRKRLVDALLWLLVPALVVSFFALRNFKVFHPRYLAVSLPAFLLVLAAGLADLRRPARIAAAVAVGLLWAASLWNHYFVPAYGKEDYRGAMRLVAARALPGEKVLAVGAQEPIYYYYRGPLPVDRLWLGYSDRPRRLADELDGKLAGARGTWVVLSRPEDLDPGGVFVRTMGGRHPGAESFRFEGVRVWHVRAGEGAAAAPR